SVPPGCSVNPTETFCGIVLPHPLGPPDLSYSPSGKSQSSSLSSAVSSTSQATMPSNGLSEPLGIDGPGSPCDVVDGATEVAVFGVPVLVSEHPPASSSMPMVAASVGSQSGRFISRYQFPHVLDDGLFLFVVVVLCDL